jgi:DNA primase
LDAQGRAVAFGGRTLQADTEPKYLNSPETAAYTKGRHLYGLHQTRNEIRRRKFAILVEGYFDLLIPYQFGVRNAVASLGTALTTEQAKLLGRFARKVVINYDGDKAGTKAAQRAIDGFLESLLREEFDVKVLILPDNADPDEFIRKYGVEEYNRRRGAAPPWIQFVIDQAVRDRNLNIPADKAAAVEEVLPYIRVVPNSIQRREYFDAAMDAFRIDKESINTSERRHELWQAVKTGTKIDKAEIKQKIAASAPLTVAEQRLLELLVHDAELRGELLPQLEASDYEALPTAAIFRALIELDKEGAAVDFDSLSAKTAEDPTASDLVPLILMTAPERTDGEAMDDFLVEAENCLAALKLMAIDRRLKELAADISAAERDGAAQRRDALILEHLEWIRRKRQIAEVRS